MPSILEKINQCSDEKLKTLLKKIYTYNECFLLFESNSESYKSFLTISPNIPLYLQSLYELFDGAYLFDTILLSTGERDCTNNYNTINIFGVNKKCHTYGELPNQYIVFAIASFGDLYCFNTNGSDEIIQWSMIEKKIIYTWGSFLVWFNSEISIAIELIQENVLLPFSE